MYPLQNLVYNYTICCTSAERSCMRIQLTLTKNIVLLCSKSYKRRTFHTLIVTNINHTTPNSSLTIWNFGQFKKIKQNKTSQRKNVKKIVPQNSTSNLVVLPIVLAFVIVNAVLHFHVILVKSRKNMCKEKTKSCSWGIFHYDSKIATGNTITIHFNNRLTTFCVTWDHFLFLIPLAST